MPRDFQMTFSGIFRVDTHTGNILKKKKITSMSSATQKPIDRLMSYYPNLPVELQ
jgi:hypothetical protein